MSHSSSTIPSSNQLLWFRNDLRTNDNPALQHFVNHLEINESGKALFFVSSKQWDLHDWSPIKVDFVKRHAAALVLELAQFNIELSIVEVDDFEGQIDYLKQYCSDNNIADVFVNSELEFNEQQRDKALLDSGIKMTFFESDVIVPKGQVLNQSGKMYKVFTPFKRAWLTHVKVHGAEYLGELQGRAIVEAQAITPEEVNVDLNLDDMDKAKAHLSEKWPLVSEVKDKLLPLFYRLKVRNYENVRDIPSVKGTSGISPYLAAGVLSTRHVFHTLVNSYPDIVTETDSPEFSWLNEIIWRDFYRHLMFDQPRLAKHQCFNSKYHQVLWPYDHDLFIAWCEGKTGYPLVDAAMRQLTETGWMHNRLRMVVASFLTKHLLIDWRLGEKFFMQHLIDGDLASNNGGWQWASSTGCDAQPYFRVFNPIRQSERFDPNGDFIRKYLPELKSIPNKQIHFPHKFIKESRLDVYWSSIVDHKQARLDALAFYK